jgi:hypothetical protein
MYGPDTLLLASKKPRIIELVAKIDSMTIDEIKLLPEKPDIIKGLLLIKEFGKTGPKLTVPEKIANRMQRLNNNAYDISILEGKIYRITAENLWIPVNSTQLEVKKGWHWIWLESKQILISNNYLAATEQLLHILVSSSELLTNGTTVDLKRLEDQRRNSLM